MVLMMIMTYDHDQNNDVEENDYVEVKMCNAAKAITFLQMKQSEYDSWDSERELRT